MTYYDALITKWATLSPGTWSFAVGVEWDEVAAYRARISLRPSRD